MDDSHEEQMTGVPPHSDTAEQALLGALLNDNAALDLITDLLDPEHFYSPDHRAIFGTIVALITATKPADPVTVFEKGRHDLVYLNQLALGGMVALINVRSYAEVVRSKWAARQIIKISAEASGAAHKPKADPYEAALKAQEGLAKLTDGAVTRSEPRWLDQTLAGHIDTITARSTGGGGQVFATGLVDLDRMFSGGVRPGRVYTIAARPSMGKTTLALTVGRNIAASDPVLFLSQEAPVEQLQDSIVASCGNVSLDKLLKPDANDPDLWARLVEGTERAAALKLMLDDQPSLRLIDVRHKIIQAQRKARATTGKPLAVVVVDYIQLMQGEGETRSVQIGNIANGLKALALTHGVAFIVLAQCNRGPDEKPDGADSMSDINESGGIEAASDAVALLHRQYVRTNDQRIKDYGQLRVVKNRIGGTGRIDLYFSGEKQFFGSWSGPSPLVERPAAPRTRAVS
jgi:replicative DNA helicase